MYSCSSRLLSFFTPTTVARHSLWSQFPFPLVLPRCNVILLTRLKLVDNSENAKKVTRLDQPYCIKLPKNKKVARFGDIITIAHRGKVHKALLVSNRQTSKRYPRYDSHNIILLDDKLQPIGTRIIGPLPSALKKRQGEFSKVIALASKFIWLTVKVSYIRLSAAAHSYPLHNILHVWLTPTLGWYSLVPKPRGKRETWPGYEAEIGINVGRLCINYAE